MPAWLQFNPDNLTFSGTPVNSDVGAFNVKLTATDGTGATVDSVFSLEVINVNDQSILDLNGVDEGGINFTTNVAPDGNLMLVVDRDLTVVDVDNNNLLSATVDIVNYTNGVSQFLTANTKGTNIERQYNPDKGILKLTGEDTVANYQKVLRTVEYVNHLRSGFDTDLAINFMVNDGESNSDIANSNVTLNTDTTASLAQGILSITDTNGGTTDDQIDLSLDSINNTVRVKFNSNFSIGEGIDVIDNQIEVPLQSITKNILLDTANGNNLIRVNDLNFAPTIVIQGGVGSDTMIGGADKDMITGGAGNDIFRLSRLTDSLASNFDVIKDLNIGVDRIDAPSAVSAANVIEFGTIPVSNNPNTLLASLGANRAATYTYGIKTFLFINDATIDYDATIEITGFTGNLDNLAIA